MNQQPPPPAPADLHAPYLTRMMLIRRYSYLTLKFSHPIISESERWEASWNGGNAAEDTETALLAKVLEELQDCGDEGHLRETTGEKRDPTNAENIILLTQSLTCVFCDARERVITLYHPSPTVAESSQDPR
jgi:hypothetical protein